MTSPVIFEGRLYTNVSRSPPLCRFKRTDLLFLHRLFDLPTQSPRLNSSLELPVESTPMLLPGQLSGKSFRAEERRWEKSQEARELLGCRRRARAHFIPSFCAKTFQRVPHVQLRQQGREFDSSSAYSLCLVVFRVCSFFFSSADPPSLLHCFLLPRVFF